MIAVLKKWLGLTPAPDWKKLLANGAQLVDVRTPEEFRQGHISGAVNYPLQTLDQHLKKLKPQVPVICCCASGMRSAAAAAQLRRQGFDAYNGGGWMGLQSKL